MLMFSNRMMMWLFLFFFFLKSYTALNAQEKKFICHFDGIKGFPVSCSDAANACNYKGILCDTNLSLIEFSVSLCGGKDIIPSEIGNLPLLKTFSVIPPYDCNSPPSGTIPTEIGNCNLTKFQIPNCNIVGTIPNEFFNNKYLERINLAGNNITTLPSTLFSELTSLVTLDLSNCKISGTLPSLFHAQYLKLNNNFFTGDLNPMLIDPNYKVRPIFIDLTLNRLNINTEVNISEIVINSYPQDINECSLHISECDFSCIDGWFPIPGYTCGCPLGFTLNPDKRTCKPICGDGILRYPKEQCDFLISPFGCSVSCKEKPGYRCGVSGCSSICGDNILVEPEECDGSMVGCRSNCTVEPGYTCSNNTCQSCASEEWDPYPYPDNFLLFPKFRALGYNLSSFAFTSCLLCSGGLAIQTRDVVSSIYCTSIESKITVPCSFACSNLSVFTSAKESLYTLKQQLEKGDFLNQILSQLFNINVTIEDNQEELTFQFSSCTANISRLTDIIYALSLDIVPNIPLLKIKSNNCTLDLSATDPPMTLFPIGGIIGIIISILLLLLLILVAYYYYQSELHQLPEEISWSFFDKLTHPWRWKYHGDSESGYYSRKYKIGSQEFNQIDSLLTTSFKKGPLRLSKITAIYNKSLTVSFINQWKITITRKIQSSEQFFPNTYKKNQDKMKVMDHYENNILRYGNEMPIPLVPVLHGTDLNVAKKIAKTGFASLSSLDAGYFGKGIYFTTHLLYTLPYSCGKRNPSVILSYVNMGNIFPVTEDHRGSNSLLGSAIKSSYNSHFALTNKDGVIYNKDNDNIICDEIVVGQESQILPAFIITLDIDSCLEEFEKWNRVIVNTEPKETIIAINDDYVLLQ